MSDSENVGQTVPVSVDRTSTADISVTSANGDVSHTAEQSALRVVSKALVTQVPKMMTEIADQRIAKADEQRQAKEDARSIKRNRNRMYTLFFALFASVIITYCLSTALKGTYLGTTFGPYSFAITILFDSGLTVWAYWHRY